MPADDSRDPAEVRAAEPDPLGLVDVIELIAPGARVTGWRPLHGGIGNAMHVVDVAMPSGTGTGFVLRRAVPESGHPTNLSHEARTLEALRPTPVPAPEVLWLDGDGEVFGRPAMAQTLLPGTVGSADVATDPAVVRGLAETLVTLQWVVDLDPLGHLDRVDDPAGLVAGLRDDPQPAVPFADTAAVREALLAGLDDLRPGRVGLCHGDFHVGNTLLEGSGPTGLVDWDHARLADPRTDLAYAAMGLAMVAGLEVADAFLAEYEALRGAVADLDWWCLRATLAAWNGVESWLPGWQALGIEVDPATVHAALAAWTDRHLAALGGRRCG